MTKPTAWMPIYWGDYLKDTGHLSTEEHGAYLLLIAHYWSTGKPLKENPKYLMKLTALSEHKFKKYLPTLSAFFTVENGHWHHARIERELSAAFDRKDAASERSKRAAATRWGRTAGSAQATPNHAYHSHNHKDHDHESVSTNSTDAARDPALNGGSGPRAHRETSQERLLRLANAHRLETLKGKT